MSHCDLIGADYHSFDGKRRWELLFEQVLVVILDTGVRHGNDCNLVGIDTASLRVKWALGGVVDAPDAYDGIVNVWVEDGRLWAGTWSGTACQLDHNSGNVVRHEFRK